MIEKDNERGIEWNIKSRLACVRVTKRKKKRAVKETLEMKICNVAAFVSFSCLHENCIKNV
jgi:hypothetical protein